MGVDKFEVDKMGVDEIGSRRSGMTPHLIALTENLDIMLQHLKKTKYVLDPVV